MLYLHYTSRSHPCIMHLAEHATRASFAYHLDDESPVARSLTSEVMQRGGTRARTQAD
jgi:hypothetical protein